MATRGLVNLSTCAFRCTRRCLTRPEADGIWGARQGPPYRLTTLTPDGMAGPRGVGERSCTPLLADQLSDAGEFVEAQQQRA